MALHIVKTRTTRFKRSGREQVEQTELPPAESFAMDGAIEIAADLYGRYSSDNNIEVIELWEISQAPVITHPAFA